MGTILKNILAFSDLEVDVPTSLPHRLNVNGIAVAPKIGGADAAGFTCTADETNVTVTRTAAAGSTDAVHVYVEYWHTIEDVTPRVPPPGKLVGLTPFFFAAGGGSGPQIARGVFHGEDGSTINAVGCSTERTGQGEYAVTFDPPFPDTCTPVATIAEDKGNTVYTVYLSNISSSGCNVTIRGETDGHQLEDADFSIVAVESASPATL